MREEMGKYKPVNYTVITVQREKHILEILGRFYPEQISYNKITTILHEEYRDVRITYNTIRSIITKLEKQGKVEVQEEKLQGVSAKIKLTEKAAKEYSLFGKERHKIKNYKDAFEEHIKYYLLKPTPENMVKIQMIESEFEHLLKEEEGEILTMDMPEEHKEILVGEIIEIKGEIEKMIMYTCLKDEHCKRIWSLIPRFEKGTQKFGEDIKKIASKLRKEEDRLKYEMLKKLPNMSNSDVMEFLEKYKLLIQLGDIMEDYLLSEEEKKKIEDYLFKEIKEEANVEINELLKKLKKQSF